MGKYTFVKNLLIKTFLPVLTGFLTVFFSNKKNHLLKVISDEIQNGKLKLQ